MKKVELTERQAVGLAGAIKLLEADGWPPGTVLSYVREIIFTPYEYEPLGPDEYDSKLERFKEGHVTVRFWFFHQPGNVYFVTVWVEKSPNQSCGKWALVRAAGGTVGLDSGLRCQFDKKGEPYKVRGKCYYLPIK